MMNYMNYKEIWQEFYDGAIEEGLDEDAAGKYAHDMLGDHFASIADNMRVQEKYKNTGG